MISCGLFLLSILNLGEQSESINGSPARTVLGRTKYVSTTARIQVDVQLLIKSAAKGENSPQGNGNEAAKVVSTDKERKRVVPTNTFYKAVLEMSGKLEKSKSCTGSYLVQCTMKIAKIREFIAYYTSSQAKSKAGNKGEKSDGKAPGPAAMMYLLHLVARKPKLEIEKHNDGQKEKVDHILNTPVEVLVDNPENLSDALKEIEIMDTGTDDAKTGSESNQPSL
ncbi:hypothetical protein Ddc_16894 [Ditylenchus destructor]|nr:hypothetical protein Ddc_16894 [Ditylenchus destructor]